MRFLLCRFINTNLHGGENVGDKVEFVSQVKERIKNEGFNKYSLYFAPSQCKEFELNINIVKYSDDI